MTVRKQGRVLVLLLMAAIFLFMLGKSVSKWGEKKVELEKIIEMENGNLASLQYTACGHRMAHRIWKETKQQPSTGLFTASVFFDTPLIFG